MTGFGAILADLNAAGVRYVLVGGIAVIRHGFVRATRDVDAIVAQDEANFDAIRDLIARWHATRPDGSPVPTDSVAPGRSLHLATPHGDLDLLPDRPSPLCFEQLITRADSRKVDGVSAPIVSLADLVSLKRLAERRPAREREPAVAVAAGFTGPSPKARRGS